MTDIGMYSIALCFLLLALIWAPVVMVMVVPVLAPVWNLWWLWKGIFH